MWLFCWSIILPTLLSGAIGFFLDRFLESHTWTLIFLIGGLIIGSINAWILINRDIRSILVKHGKQSGKNYIK
jgi:predicted F0F1-ATPase subunit